MQRQPEAVATESVRFDDLRAGGDIVSVDALDQVWLEDVDLFETASVVNPEAIEHRPHGAVGENGALFEPAKERTLHRSGCPRGGLSILADLGGRCSPWTAVGSR